ncbi:MAG: diaminopimelate epimerase [Solirubrobacterales bacterium]
MALTFEKWQALGNDYLIVEAAALPWELTADRVRAMCSAHFGAHSDGVLLLSASEDERFVARLRIFNPDGSEAELSGNGAREAILYLVQRGWTSETEFSIDTAAGEIRPTVTSPTTCRVAMGQAATMSADYPGGAPDGRGVLEADGRRWEFQHVSIGNPQCAIAVPEGLEELDLPAIGPAIESHELFPNRTNVSFYEVEGARVRARIFERGVGETLSSGTGATGAAVAAHLAGAPADLTVALDGGELEVEIGPKLHVHLSGWAVPVYRGSFSDEFTDSLEDR